MQTVASIECNCVLEMLICDELRSLECVAALFYPPSRSLGFVLLNECARLQDAVTICTLGIGTAFGESILDNTPRHATIVSRETSELLRIEQREFKSLWEVRRESGPVRHIHGLAGSES